MLHAIVIGIDQFEDPFIRGLRYARKDAEAVTRLLERVPAGERRVTTLLDKQATLRGVQRAMDDLCRAVRPGDLALIYIASHGTPERRSPVTSPSAFLVLHDTEYAYIHATGVDLELQLADWMRRIEKASVVAVLLDACFSGAAGGRTFERRHMSGDPPPPPVSLKGLDLGEGRFVLTAADDEEVALESEDLEQGVFTHHLLQALQPEGPGAATIGVGLLYDQISRAVSKGTEGRQRPILNGRIGGAEMPLFRR
jgi:uncharacterized caspase-like protein